MKMLRTGGIGEEIDIRKREKVTERRNSMQEGKNDGGSVNEEEE